MSVEIPVPITYNPYKHHFRFLLKEIGRWREMPWAVVREEILTIGNNLIDFYTGHLDISEICYECIGYFRSHDLLAKDRFQKWLDASHYKKIRLSDQSTWLIKEGNAPERFIHIHPAKFSEHSVRVRATTLKTVIALEVRSVGICKEQQTNLQEVNAVRKELLELSPIKTLQAGTGILRLWELFENNLHT